MMSSSTGGATTATAAPPRKYGVLYYKRKKKVHKQKGVSRLDGILIVEPPPSCMVTLADDADGSAAMAGGSAALPKKSATVSSGINWTISKKSFGIEDDAQSGKASTVQGGRNEFRIGTNGLHEGDIVELVQWDCEITAVLDGGGGGVGGGIAAKKATMTTFARRPVQPLVSRKRPLGMGSGVGLGGGRLKTGLGSTTTSTNPLLGKRNPPLQPGRTSGGIGLGRGAALAGRRPPPQPKPSRTEDSSDDDDEDDDNGEENKTAAKANILLKKPSSLLGGGKKRRVVVSGGPRRGLGGTIAAAASSAASGTPGAANPFPGAIGTVIAPASIRGILRPHQQEGVTFLWNCLTGASPALNRVAEESGAGSAAARGAILADEMGLGKTLMTITTMFALHRRNRDHRFVVVCPSSLVSNWSKEFDKWISKASQPKRVVIRRGGEEGLRAIKAFVPVKPNMAEILIVSYELFRMNIKVLKEAEQIGLLVVDEGHRLKNTSGSQTLTALNALRCESRLLITGTPIQNNLSEFHNVVNFVCPGILDDLNSFRRTYERPINASNNRAASAEQRAKGKSLSRALDRVTSTFMLRRLQRDVLKDHLPPRSEILLFCRPSERQKAEYISMTKGVKGGAGPSSTGVSADALTLLTKVRKLCSHPYLLNGENDDPFASKSAARKEDDDSACSGSNEHVILSGKLSILESLLTSIRSEAPTDKVVVISNFTSALSVIEEAVLQRKRWSSIRLDGTTEQNARQSLVDSFNRGSVDQSFVFLLSSKAGGCGLNLIGANRLVMFDPDWNPATDMQAMARVYRQGQKKPCYIYRMFTSGTVEEVVYQRQTQKSNLATLTVDGQGSSKKSAGFTKEELRDCFTLKVGCACDTKRKVGKKWDEYDGVDSLQEQGCTDAPLLAITDECIDVLSFVRIVPDDEPTVRKEDDGDEGRSSVENDDDGDDDDDDFKVPTAKTGFLDDASFGDEDDFSSEEEFEG